MSGERKWNETIARMVSLHNSTGSLDASCLAEHADDPVYCAHPPNVLPFITTPTFVSSSHTDTGATSSTVMSSFPASWTIGQQRDLYNCFWSTLAPDGNCSAAPRHGEIVDDYVNAITQLLEPARRGPHGFFVSNCLRHHCIDGNYSYDIRIDNESLVESIGSWAIDGRATRRLDAPQLQSNPTCPPPSL
eukprot:COSAG06_NODE_360_length_16832_cov_9.250209_20_plen_190_part_00